jgi:hypothetical protein
MEAVRDDKQSLPKARGMGLPQDRLSVVSGRLNGLFLTFRRPFLELARLQSCELIDGRAAHPIAA